MEELAGDLLLRGLLERDPITDIGLERLLTNVRHTMLTFSALVGLNGTKTYSSFLRRGATVLSQRIYLPLPESEAAQAIELQAALGDKIKAGDIRFRRSGS